MLILTCTQPLQKHSTCISHKIIKILKNMEKKLQICESASAEIQVCSGPLYSKFNQQNMSENHWTISK